MHDNVLHKPPDLQQQTSNLLEIFLLECYKYGFGFVGYWFIQSTKKKNSHGRKTGF